MNRMRHGWTWALMIAALELGATAVAQDRQAPQPEFDVRAHYTKYEARIPMRDGKRLFTSIYVPKDNSRAYPFLMTRTPYTVAPYGEDNYRPRLGPSVSFDRAGYIFVFQDVRGRYMSEGAFVEMRPHIDHPRGNQDVDESTDTYDTVEWLLKNVPNNNGKVGIWGISYPGFFTSASRAGHGCQSSSAPGGRAAAHRADGGIPAAGPRRTDAREVPQQLGEA